MAEFKQPRTYEEWIQTKYFHVQRFLYICCIKQTKPNSSNKNGINFILNETKAIKLNFIKVTSRATLLESKCYQLQNCSSYMYSIKWCMTLKGL